jgi:hypothetical protein
VTLINWLLKPKCMLKHFFFEVFFVGWKQKYFFQCFWWKPGILIPDLYLYGIKIHTDINQHGVEKYAGKSQFFPKMIFWIYIFFRLGRPGPIKRLSWNQPKMKLGQDRPKREPCCGWTQPSRVGWADVPARKTNSGLLCMQNVSTITRYI